MQIENGSIDPLEVGRAAAGVVQMKVALSKGKWVTYFTCMGHMYEARAWVTCMGHTAGSRTCMGRVHGSRGVTAWGVCMSRASE